MGNGKGKGKGKGACAWDGAAGIGYVYALRAPETNTKRGRSGGGCQLLIIGRINVGGGRTLGVTAAVYIKRRCCSIGGAPRIQIWPRRGEAGVLIMLNYWYWKGRLWHVWARRARRPRWYVEALWGGVIVCTRVIFCVCLFLVLEIRMRGGWPARVGGGRRWVTTRGVRILFTAEV